jgi:glycosyltransferase 2 family protein
MKWTLKFRIFVTVALAVWLVLRTDGQQLREATRHWRAEFWLAAVGLYVVLQMISGLRWQILTKPLGFKKSVFECVRFYFIAMFFNLFLPTSVGGDVVRAWYLDRGSGRKASAFVTVLVDRLSGLMVLLALAGVGVILSPIHLENWISTGVGGGVGSIGAGLALAPWWLGLACRFDRVRRLTEPALNYLHRPLLIAGSMALSLIIQSGNVALVWLLGLAIRAPIPASYYWIMVPMVTLLTLLPISLNGMGVREGGTILFLAPLGISHATALSLALLWFSVFTVVSLLGGLLYVFPQLTGKLAKEHGEIQMEWKRAA